MSAISSLTPADGLLTAAQLPRIAPPRLRPLAVPLFVGGQIKLWSRSRIDSACTGGGAIAVSKPPPNSAPASVQPIILCQINNLREVITLVIYLGHSFPSKRLHHARLSRCLYLVWAGR